jgi:hypothetical protein
MQLCGSYCVTRDGFANATTAASGFLMNPSCATKLCYALVRLNPFGTSAAQGGIAAAYSY